MLLQYGLTALLFVWVAQMVAVVSIATMEGGFGVRLNRRNLIGVVLFSAFVSATFLIWAYK